MKMPAKLNSRKKSGCGAIFLQSLLITLMLILNGLFIKTFVLESQNWGEEIRIKQALQFILPILMIFGELWLYDLFFARQTKLKM